MRLAARRGVRTTMAGGFAVLLLMLALWTGAGQTAGEGGPVTVCRMGDLVPSDHPYAGADGSSARPFAIAYYDADGDQSLDVGEALYLDAEGFDQTAGGSVSTPDVRWTDVAEAGDAGTHPAASDHDSGTPVTPLGSANYTFQDTERDGYDAADPVLLDVDGNAFVSPNDRYLAPADRAGDTVTSDSTAVQAPLEPFFTFLLWVDTDDPGTPGGRLFFGDRDFDGQLDAGDLCLSHHVVEATQTTSPTPTKTIPDSPSPTKTTSATNPRPTTASPSPTTTQTTQQPGGFARDAGRFDGRYVALTLDLQEGAITEWTTSGTAFFAQVTLDCPCNAEVVQDANGRPTALVVQANTTFLTIYDQPAGLVSFASFGPEPLVVDTAPGTTVSQAGGGTIRIQADGQTAWLAVHTTTTPDGRPSLQQTTQAGDTLRLAVSGAGVFFVSDPTGGEPLFQQNRDTVDEAILERRLTAQVQVLRTERGNEPQVLAYEDVRDIQVRQPADLEYEIEIDADFPEGRAFLFQFPVETLPAETVNVRYFYQADRGAPVEVRTLVEAQSLDDVLQADDAGQATYFVETTPEGFQVAVAVADFSIQLFQVLGIPPEAAPIFAYGVVLVFLFLGVGVMGVMIGRRGRPKWTPKRKEIVPLSGL